jgi:hypothetical protein
MFDHPRATFLSAFGFGDATPGLPAIFQAGERIAEIDPHYVKTLAERGVILAVCSKNNAVVAETGFSHLDSMLR